jgi:hypothetical protein
MGAGHATVPPESPVWAVDLNTGAVLTGDPTEPLRLTGPDGATRATTAEPLHLHSGE